MRNKNDTIYVFHTECLFTRGGEKYIFELFRRIAYKHPVVIYFQAISPEWEEKYKKEGICVRLLWKPRRFYWLLLPLTIFINTVRLKKTIHKNDTIYSTNFPFNLIAVYLSNKTICHCSEPLPIFYDPVFIHSLPILSQIALYIAKLFYSPFDKIAIKRSSVFTTLNTSVTPYLLRVYKKRPDAYIPNGIDTTFFSPSPHKIMKKNQVVILGHSTDYTVFKGTKDFLEILYLLKRRYNKFKAIITETLKDEKIKNQYLTFIRQNALDKHVSFVGNLTEKQLVHFYRSLDVFCFTGSPDCAEGSTASLSVLEAQSCGVPVIRGIGNKEEIIDGVTGYYINPKNHSRVVNVLSTFISRSQLKRTIMARQARNYIQNNFNWDSSAHVLEYVLRTLRFSTD